MAGGGSLGEGLDVVAGLCVACAAAAAAACDDDAAAAVVVGAVVDLVCVGVVLLAPNARDLSGEGDVAEVLKKPRREELASRAMCMFSSVRKFSEGEAGESERDVEVRLLVFSGGGAREPSDVLGLEGAVVEIVTGALEPGPIRGASLTIGEYCDIGDEPLKAPGGGAWRCGGGAARVLWSIVGDASRGRGGAGAGRGF